jgi:hypothetical protein
MDGDGTTVRPLPPPTPGKSWDIILRRDVLILLLLLLLVWPGITAIVPPPGADAGVVAVVVPRLATKGGRGGVRWLPPAVAVAVFHRDDESSRSNSRAIASSLSV